METLSRPQYLQTRIHHKIRLFPYMNKTMNRCLPYRRALQILCCSVPFAARTLAQP